MKNHSSIDTSSQRNQQISFKYRRLDSLAQLIYGEAICGAAYFDNKKIICAVNKNNNKHYFSEIKDYLVFLNKTIRALKDKDKNNNFNANQAIIKIGEICKEYASVIKILNERNNIKSLYIALNKLTISIVNHYYPPNYEEELLSEEFVNALKNEEMYFEKGLEDLNDQENKVDIHAEMKILQKIFEDEFDEFKSYYIGISKKCCLNCECVIKAVQQVYPKININEKTIKTRTEEGHNIIFRCAVPQFLRLDDKTLPKEKREAIRKEYMKLIKVKLEEKYLNEDTEIPKSLEEIFYNSWEIQNAEQTYLPSPLSPKRYGEFSKNNTNKLEIQEFLDKILNEQYGIYNAYIEKRQQALKNKNNVPKVRKKLIRPIISNYEDNYQENIGVDAPSLIETPTIQNPAQNNLQFNSIITTLNEKITSKNKRKIDNLGKVQEDNNSTQDMESLSPQAPLPHNPTQEPPKKKTKIEEILKQTKPQDSQVLKVDKLKQSESKDPQSPKNKHGPGLF